MKPYVYCIGSLANERIPALSNDIAEATGYEVFADWFGAGKFADVEWKQYEKARGFTYGEALKRPAAINVFEFDKRHLIKADAVVLIAPAGRSGHLELGWSLGRGVPGFILFPDGEPDEKWDVMLQFATGVHFSLDTLVTDLKELFDGKGLCGQPVGAPRSSGGGDDPLGPSTIGPCANTSRGKPPQRPRP